MLTTADAQWGYLAGPTFHGLLCKEVMGHDFDTGMKRRALGLLDDVRKILQHQPSRHVGPFALEFGEIVAQAATDVDQKDIVCLLQLHHQLRDRVEPDVHPARTALVVGGHVIVELGGMFGMVAEELEEMRVGPEAQLEGTIFAVGRVAIVVLA